MCNFRTSIVLVSLCLATAASPATSGTRHASNRIRGRAIPLSSTTANTSLTNSQLTYITPRSKDNKGNSSTLAPPAPVPLNPGDAPPVLHSLITRNPPAKSLWKEDARWPDNPQPFQLKFRGQEPILTKLDGHPAGHIYDVYSLSWRPHNLRLAEEAIAITPKAGTELWTTALVVQEAFFFEFLHPGRLITAGAVLLEDEYKQVDAATKWMTGRWRPYAILKKTEDAVFSVIVTRLRQQNKLKDCPLILYRISEAIKKEVKTKLSQKKVFYSSPMPDGVGIRVVDSREVEVELWNWVANGAFRTKSSWTLQLSTELEKHMGLYWKPELCPEV